MKDSDDFFDKVDDTDDDFDYRKEIEAIEAQERELEELRKQKRAEMERRHAERNQQKEEPDTVHQTEVKQSTVNKRRERREKKAEAEWLGDVFDDGVETVKVPKKKSHKGLVVLVAVLIVAIIGGAGFAYKLQMDKKTVSDFEAKVAAFQTEKLDGVTLGSYQSYFDDYFKSCQDAIDAKNLSAISTLETQWTEVEAKLTEVTNGKTSLDAFVKSANETLGVYNVSEDLKKTYDALMADIKTAQDNCAYDQITDLQSRVDALATNLKSDNLKQVQTLQNAVDKISLDNKYVDEKDKTSLDDAAKEIKQYIADEDYQSAISSLNALKTEKQSVADSITKVKESEAAKAESEAAVAKAAAESKAKAESESLAKQTSTTESTSSSSSSSSSTSSSSSNGYILSNSNSKYLKSSDLKGLSSRELMLARNEIYARHGRKFNDKDIQNYFNGKSWYKGTISPEKFSVSVLNDYEIKNIDLIVKAEN